MTLWHGPRVGKISETWEREGYHSRAIGFGDRRSNEMHPLAYGEGIHPHSRQKAYLRHKGNSLEVNCMEAWNLQIPLNLQVQFGVQKLAFTDIP